MASNALAVDRSVSHFAEDVARPAPAGSVHAISDGEIGTASSPAREMQERLNDAVLANFGQREMDSPRISRNQLGVILAIAGISWSAVFAAGYLLL